MAAISRKTNQWIALVVGNLTIPCVVAWKYYSGEASARVVVIAALASILIFNVSLLMAILSRVKKLGQSMPRSLYVGALCMAILSVSLTAAAVHSLPQRNEYLDLALSGTPTDEIEPKEKALVVEYMRRDFAASNAYDRIVAKTKPASPALYSPASFTNADVMRSVSSQFKQGFENDLAYYRLLQNNANEFHEEMAAVDPDYLKSFETSLRKRETQRDKAFEMEQQCAAATLALYDYAAKNSKEIVVRGENLHFANDKVRSEFNRQLEESKSLFDGWQTALQEAARMQQRDREGLGLPYNSAQ